MLRLIALGTGVVPGRQLAGQPSMKGRKYAAKRMRETIDARADRFRRGGMWSDFVSRVRILRADGAREGPPRRSRESGRAITIRRSSVEH